MAINQSHGGPNRVGSEFDAAKFAASPKASQVRKMAEVCALED
jgi:hypothetical protein